MSTGCFSGGGGGLPSWAKWDDACPAWSPNGKQIAFASNRAAVEASVKVRAASREWGYHYDLFVMNGDGTGVRRLTYLGRTRSVDDSAPEWSEQGRMILFAVTTPLELVYRDGRPSAGPPITSTSREGQRSSEFRAPHSGLHATQTPAITLNTSARRSRQTERKSRSTVRSATTSVQAGGLRGVSGSSA